MDTVYSHPPEDGRPGVELVDHLADVAARVELVVPADATTPAGEPLRDVVEPLAYVHDFGKATTYFQRYLLDGQHPEYDQYRHHAPIGSFAAYYALDARGFDTETCLAGFVAVAKHHGSLPDIAEYVHRRAHRRKGISANEMNSAERQQTAIMNQIEDIDEHARKIAIEVFNDATANHGDWESFRDGFFDESILKDIEETVATSGTVPGVNREALSESCYGLALQCWSSLILADKTSAAGTPDHSNTYAADPPSLERLDEHVAEIEAGVSTASDGTRSERLNHHRSRARERVLGNTERLADAGGGVATLTLPTGMGKTLTGLSAALDLRDRLDGGRVVYALPFTSIIDQVVDEAEDIYDTDSTGRLLTAHHHLAETTIRDEQDAEEADRNDDVAAMLAESWCAGLTVTTFVQLFESLAGPKNRQSMKLPALRDSVVVLDEPQSLPLDWWKLVPRLVSMLTEQYDATVIAMTATQPELFEASELFDDATELIDDPDAYFGAVERVRYELDGSTERYIDDQSGPKPYDDAAATLVNSFDAGESALAVCNTIDSTRELTERVEDRTETVAVAGVYADLLAEVGHASEVDTSEVADRVREAGDGALLHLSTRLRPVDRLTLIETAKELTENGHPLVVVSTQLVEAGVDISFDRVYRDLAPIDSIVQAAGRCNRSFEREQGRVTVWWLDALGEQAKTPAEAVYNRGTSLLPVAAATLDSVRGGDGTLSEVDVARTAVTQYYRQLHEEKDVGKQTYPDYVDEARAEKLGDLSLIDQRRAADVFIVRTDAERDLAEQIREANDNYDFETLDRLLDETKPLRISIPYHQEDSETADAIRKLDPILGQEEGLWLLDTRDRGSFFDATTGFVVPDSTVDHQFL